ncbi:MAG: sigma-70 family RNA polymerase sigma factor [Planctomycetota bacterium]
MVSDAQLVKAVLAGDKAAFATLVERYENPARAIALNVLGCHHSAQDAAQEAFIKAYQNLATLRKPKAFGPWLLRITQRAALLAVKHTPREIIVKDFASETGHRGDGRLDKQANSLLGLVARLPEAEKQVIMLHYFGSYSVRAIADIRGKSVGTITKQLSLAHRNLRRMLKDTKL